MKNWVRRWIPPPQHTRSSPTERIGDTRKLVVAVTEDQEFTLADLRIGSNFTVHGSPHRCIKLNNTSKDNHVWQSILVDGTLRIASISKDAPVSRIRLGRETTKT